MKQRLHEDVMKEIIEKWKKMTFGKTNEEERRLHASIHLDFHYMANKGDALLAQDDDPKPR